MAAQLSLGETPVPAPKLCEWCGEQPATTRVIATDACQACADGGPRYRVTVSLQRWKRAAERRRDR